MQGARLVATGGALVTLENMNLDNNGELNTDFYNTIYFPPSSIFRFSGNTTTDISQSITGTNTATFFDRLEIAKGGGYLQLKHWVLQVYSEVRFISGLFDLNSNALYLMSSQNSNHAGAFLSGESELSRITGGLVVALSRNLPANSTTDPANLGLVISTVDCKNINIYRGHIPRTGNIGNGTSISRYYDITHGGWTGVNCNDSDFYAPVRFKYFDGELNGFNENNLVMWESMDSGTVSQQGLNVNWTNLGFTSRNTIGNYIQQSAYLQIHHNSNPIGDFSSRFTLSTAYNPRPGKTSQPQLTSHPATLPHLKNSLKTWPNPANKILWININATATSKADISIYDVQGRLIRTQHNQLTAGKNLLSMDIKSLATGTYYMSTQWHDGKERNSVMFVKQ